jgi:serine/threonine-protein kinase RsbW
MGQVTTEGTALDPDVVLLTVPAQTAYLGVLRTAAAGLAARLQFTLDEIEDLRIAVDEACAMLIRLTSPDADLECRFAVAADTLGVEVAVPGSVGGPAPDTTSFAWTVLTSLTSAARTEVAADGRVMIALTARRSRPGR